MDKKYLVISRCEDEPYIQYMTEADVVMALNDEWREYKTITEDQIVKEQHNFLLHFPARSVLIMCGKLCQTHPIEKVVSWRLVEGDR